MLKRSSNGFLVECEIQHEQIVNFKISEGKTVKKPFFVEWQNISLYILGTIIYENKIQPQKAAQSFLESNNSDNLLKEFNGNFLIIKIDKSHHNIQIITDRFGSISCFLFRNAGNIFISTCYSDIWFLLKQYGYLRLNKFAFFEFIHLQKLLGTKTFDENTICVPSATTVNINVNDSNSKKYWQPNYTKKIQSNQKNSYQLAELLKTSYTNYTSDNKKYGLMLSGGLDSRAVLAAIHEPVACFTIGDTKNNEYKVANLLAKAAKCPHFFLPRKKEHYAIHFELAVDTGSSMNTFDHAHFLGFKENVQSHCEVLFHGHGFDYMYQGMYLPTKIINILAFPTLLQKIKPLKSDIVDEYLYSVKYRLKDLDTFKLVRKSFHDNIKNFLHNSASDLAAEVIDRTDEVYDIWEYFHLFNLGRHYTHLNLQSMRMIAEERTIAFDNDLFDYYFSLPVSGRIQGRILKKAISLLNNDLMLIRNANTNMKANLTLTQMTFLTYLNQFLKKMPGKTIILSPPGRQDRSWPDRDRYILTNEKLRQKALQLSHSEHLHELEFFDMDMISQCIDQHFNRKYNFGALIMSLLTIDQFLKM